MTSKNLLMLIITLSIVMFAPVPGITADPKPGAKLYVGTTVLSNGGAPCLACHAHAGSGLGQTVSYGPDLTYFHDDYGAEEVAAVLQDLSFPSMETIYAMRPLTEQEIDDLGAFFEQAASSPVPAFDRLFLWVLIILGVLLLALVLVSRRNMTGVQQTLNRNRQKTANKGGLS
ncbi:c-type cytochrome [Desulfofustis limnaeus]|jgi:cytochrome c553|uniref:Cytochrome c domain-containing protein n=1 Tax=Desulfofustis limnaeus TaxID=2740163 RepID=A0ABN6M5G2_9BACT|nr:hypothetical protein [Desulfofustis limnaeus]MDX9895107.1 hypothetical protein [Desulfofustis sp.]BDD88117.1 hypothetical protein DPPLL_24820 [Desulfofustis limnaeus]